MVYLNYLTEDAYVQVGEYTVEEFFREGQHVVQRLENVTNSQEVATSFPYTSAYTGRHQVSFTATDSGDSDGASCDFDVIVGGTSVSTTTVADGESENVSIEVDVEAGQVIDVSIETSEGSVSDVSITMEDRALPDSFYREWATYAEGRDNVLGYDPGAYGIGTPVSRRTIVVPSVKKVSLLYLNYVASTKEERVLVQYDGTLSDLESAGLVGSSGERIVFTEDEWIQNFGAQGFNRFGFVMPPKMARSQVQELGVYHGDYVDAEGNVIESDINLYLQPIYMYQEKPMFDYVYVTGGWRGDLDPDVTDISGHLFRWQGQFNSESIAPINRAGEAIIRDGYDYYVDESGDLQEITPADSGITQDGQTYSGADAYNVRNYRRR
mgnify:FL=1